ncbi:olfactory receptor 6N2-like [Nerophis lumbriciformis]|uniref:olfactory receptor 6N2-like n=1 Tax=Nerophis lumbriciformis TaxID=546530 RepID=UPI002AE00D64|nr:olfactory receptor 6N2-like [Nerophis lumbriciformis]
MENATSYFNLTMFVHIGPYRYPAFAVCLALYGFIVCANLVIILVIGREKSLQEPMYIFIAFLSFNSLYGSTGFFPRLLLDLLSNRHLISRTACFTQIYFVYTYACNEMTTLSVMAYDRYVAVCQPLHYHTRMTAARALSLAALAWLPPAFFLAACIYLSASLPLCGNHIQKVFCANWNVVKLSCVPTTLNNVVGMMVTVTTVFCPLFFVLYTYARIVKACWRRSDEFKGKVFQSCSAHVVTFIIFSITAFCDIALSRYDLEEVNPFAAVILSLEFVVIPPFLNPLVYGLKLPEIRRHISKLLGFID